MNQRPLQSFMSVGIVHFMAFPECLKGEGPIVETLRLIAEDHFFSAVEMGPIYDDGARREAAALLASSGLSVGFGAQPMLLVGQHDLNSLNDSVRQAALDCCYRGIEQAAELGASKFAVLSGPDPGEADRPAALRALVQSLVALGNRCREHGIQFCLETFDQAIDKKCLIGSNALAVEVSKEVRQSIPDFGLMLDLSHLPLQFETTRDALTTAKDHLAHIHIGNCVVKDPSHPLYGDHHPRFGYPGGENGVDELREFLSVLLEIGYLAPDARRAVAFEVKPAPGESSTAVIAHAKRTLEHAWATI